VPEDAATVVKVPEFVYRQFSRQPALRWRDELIRLFWRWCQQSTDPRAKALVHAAARVDTLYWRAAADRRIAQQYLQQNRGFMANHLRPTRVGETLERLVEEGSVSRTEATTLENRMLEWVDATGAWIWKDAEDKTRAQR
jgi:hypothetical protein